jgi:YD repeat-containing protein
MKSRIFLYLLLTIILIVSGCSQQLPVENDIEKLGLTGDIESITVSKYLYEDSDGEVMKSDIKEEVLTSFKKNGMIDYEVSKDYISELYIDSVNYQYDLFGRLVSKEGIGNRIRYEYHSNGLLTNEMFIIDGEVEWIFIYNYDSIGKLKEKHEFWEDERHTKRIYEYNSDGRLVLEYHMSDSVKTSTQSYFYDEKGEKSKVCTNELGIDFIEFYDSNGGVIEIVTPDYYGNEKDTTRYNYEVILDQFRNPIQEIRYKNGYPELFIETIITYR